MKVGQTYITSKNREMEVLHINGNGERARCRFSDGTEADVIVSKCKDYKLVESNKESEHTEKEIKVQHIIIDNCDCDSGINVKGIKHQLDIDMSEKAIGGVISSLIKKGHIIEDDEEAGVFTASVSPYYFLSDEFTEEEIEDLKIK
jgi:hypothetical protein